MKYSSLLLIPLAVIGIALTSPAEAGIINFVSIATNQSGEICQKDINIPDETLTHGSDAKAEMSAGQETFEAIPTLSFRKINHQNGTDLLP